VLAFTILQSLKEALKEWNETDDYKIADDKWHMTAWYDNIRTKLESQGPDFGFCKEFEVHELEWVCKYQVKSRSEYTPRAYPSLTTLHTLMPVEMLATLPEYPAPTVYDPPEQFNPDLHPPPGSVDVLNIVEAGVDFKSTLNPDYTTNSYKRPKFVESIKMPVGKDFSFYHPNPGYCDGSVDSFCRKGKDEKCLLSGHNDERSHIGFSNQEGWLVLNIPDLKYGYIALKMYTGGDKSEDFSFDFALDGVISSWNETDYSRRFHALDRPTHVFTILKNFVPNVDDPAILPFGSPDSDTYEEKEVELALRINGNAGEWALAQIYWA
jgi:hypothetical protein